MRKIEKGEKGGDQERLESEDFSNQKEDFDVQIRISPSVDKLSGKANSKIFNLANPVHFIATPVF